MKFTNETVAGLEDGELLTGPLLTSQDICDQLLSTENEYDFPEVDNLPRNEDVSEFDFDILYDIMFDNYQADMVRC